MNDARLLACPYRLSMQLTVAILVFAAPALAQTSWWRTYGGTGREQGYSVAQTLDGGHVIAGYTESFGAGYSDAYLVKTGSSGDTIWTRTYGGTGYDYGYSVQQTADSGYIISGRTPDGSGYCDVYIIRTNAAGDTMWTRTYGGTGKEYGNSVQLTSDGGFIIAGYTESFGAGPFDVYLIKTDAPGDTVWTRPYGGAGTDQGSSVVQTPGGGYVIAGWTDSYGAGNYDAYLVKTNASGDTMWTRTYGGADYDWGYSAQQTADSGYIIAGVTQSFGAGDRDVWLIKTDAYGDTQWTRTYGGASMDEGYFGAQTSDGGYIIAGLTFSFGAGECDVYLVRTDALGDTQWTRTYGGTDYDEGRSVRQTADGGYIISGRTGSFGAGNFDVYLIKTDASGSIAIEETPAAEVRPTNAPTIVRSSLLLPKAVSGERSAEGACLLDIAGRSVLELHAGTNDVSRLAPGVYFVHSGPSAARRKPSALVATKVVIAR